MRFTTTTMIKFLKDEEPDLGVYWYRHKDSTGAPEIGKVDLFDCIPIGTSKPIKRQEFYRYLWSGPIVVPLEEPLGLQMAKEADDNRLLTPKEMIADILQALDDPEDIVSKSKKAIFISLYDEDGHYSTAAMRCNLSNSEAVALLTMKANGYCVQIRGDKE